MRPTSTPPEGSLLDVRRLAVDTGRAVIESARAGQARQAIDALGSFRLLCGHRRGPEGVATWMDQIENWLRADVEGFTTGADWYVGRPLIVTQNDYGLDLYNGDTGVVIESDGRSPGGRLRAAGRHRRGQSDPARGGRHRLRHDRAQEPGLPVSGGGLPGTGS